MFPWPYLSAHSLPGHLEAGVITWVLSGPVTSVPSRNHLRVVWLGLTPPSTSQIQV
jgi:hypothetical protein